MANDLPDSPGDFLRGQIVQTSLGVLKPPENIIQTIQGSKALYFSYRTLHLARIDLYAQIEGLIAGNPPYNPVDLAKHKLSHIANFNNLDARSLFDRGALAYWNLLNEAATLIKFEIRPGSWLGKTEKRTKGQTDPDLVKWADIMADHWNTVVRSWPSFAVAFNTLAGQLVKFGVSPVLFSDERDWRWRTVELSRFFVEDQAQTDIDLVTSIFVETIFTTQYLYGIYDQFKDVEKPPADSDWDYEKCPWNMIELSGLLLWIANTFAKNNHSSPFMDMMDIQKRIQNKDLTFNAVFSDNVRIVSQFQKEYDGTISHYMFHALWDQGKHLFFQSNQYKRMEEGVIIFTASPGEFTIHSNRGLGHKIFSGSQAMMQLDCSIIDMARMSATPIIKGLSTGSKDFEAIRFYPGVPTNIGTAEFVQNQLGENIGGLIQASQYILSKMNYNIANSGEDPSQPDSSVGSISPSQARMQSFKEFSVLKNGIAHFYGQLDLVFINMTIKMLNSKATYPGHEYAQEWKDRCIEDGVPEEIFAVGKDTDVTGMPKHLRCRATRVAGDGSTLARILGLQELGPISGGFGPKQAAAYQREYVIATMGPEYLPAFGPTEDTDESSGGASLAGVENAIMRAAESPVFSMDNEHKAHFVTHAALAKDTIEKIQQQQLDPVGADKIFVVLVPHMTEHWNALSKSPFSVEFINKVKQSWGQIEQYATLNHHNAAKQYQGQIKAQQEAQAKQDQVLSDQQLKNLQVKGDISRKDVQAQSKEQRANQQSENTANIQQQKVQSDAANKRLAVQLDANNKTLKQQGDALAATPLPELRQGLSNINGADPSPYNIEVPPK